MNNKEAINKAIDVMRRQHKSDSTINTYSHWLRHYIFAVRQMPNSLTSELKMERFLTELARRDVSASTQNQAFNAIRFFYVDVLGVKLKDVDALRATRPAHQRNAPSERDTRTLLSAVHDGGGYPSNLIVNLMYGCGLRTGEAVSIRIKDLDLAQSKLVIREPKFGHDRTVRLPCSLMSRIEQQIEYARIVWKKDKQQRLPIQLPHQLAKKYPEYEFSFQWAWFTPLKYQCTDPHQPSRMVRWHMLSDTIQRAVKRARRLTGIMAVPHELRHAYGTHCLNRGENPRAIQMAMGHKSLETTMGYLHAEAMSVRSPIDVTVNV